MIGKTLQRQCGLSPLARGTLLKAAQVKIVQRFIPAGAGNSVNTAAGAAGIAVYPRWRGELPVRAFLLVGQAGLSPLARGTL